MIYRRWKSNQVILKCVFTNLIKKMEKQNIRKLNLQIDSSTG